MKKGIIIGKFAPLHIGHLDLIISGSKIVDELYVCVYGENESGINIAFRLNWLKKTFKNHQFIHVINVSNLEDLQFVQTKYGQMDYFFTSSDLNVDKVKKIWSSAKTYSIPLKHHFNSQKIMEKPMVHFHEIASVAKNHFTKKVLLYGSESCGKTILTQDLARIYNTSYCLEYYREWRENIEIPYGEKLDDLAFMEIAIGQYRSMQKHLKSPKVNKIFFSDTDVMTTKIYSELHLGENAKKIALAIEQLINRQEFDLILLLYPDVRWVSDDVRTDNSDELRIKNHNLFEQELIKRGLDYKVLKGDYLTKFIEAQKYVDELLEE